MLPTVLLYSWDMYGARVGADALGLGFRVSGLGPRSLFASRAFYSHEPLALAAKTCTSSNLERRSGPCTRPYIPELDREPHHPEGSDNKPPQLTCTQQPGKQSREASLLTGIGGLNK